MTFTINPVRHSPKKEFKFYLEDRIYILNDSRDS